MFYYENDSTKFESLLSEFIQFHRKSSANDARYASFVVLLRYLSLIFKLQEI